MVLKVGDKLRTTMFNAHAKQSVVINDEVVRVTKTLAILAKGTRLKNQPLPHENGNTYFKTIHGQTWVKLD